MTKHDRDIYRDHSAKTLLKGQRWRILKARLHNWKPEILATVVVVAAISLMALPMETGIKVFASVVAFAVLLMFVEFCTGISRDFRDQGKR